MKELFQDRNFRSAIRLALGCAAGWLAKRGIEIDGATLELVAATLAALASAAWSAHDNRRKTDEGKEAERQNERRQTNEEGNEG